MHLKYLWGMTFIAVLLGPPIDARAKIRIVSTIPDFGAIAQEIGGNLVEVTALVRPTQDPHFVDAKPSFVIKLNRAQLLLLVGMELEGGWLPPLLVGSRNRNIQRGTTGYLDCSTLIAPLEVQAPDRAKGDIHPGGNPHYWTDPRNGLQIARGIAKQLALIDSANAAAYRQGAERFTKRLQKKITEWRSKFAPHRGTKVVVYHRSWVYFLNFARFSEIGALEPKPGIPPSPDHVAQLIRAVKDSGVKYVIQESFYPTQLSSIFAKKSGAKLKILPTMVGAGGSRDYIGMVDMLVAKLTQ